MATGNDPYAMMAGNYMSQSPAPKDYLEKP